MNSIRQNSLFVKWQIFVSILLLFTACDAEDIKSIVEIEQPQNQEIKYAIEKFDPTILFNAQNPEVQTRASSLVIETVVSEVEFNVYPADLYILPGTGYDITIEALGIFTDSITIQISDYYNENIIATEQIQGDGETGGSVNVTIPPYFSNNGIPRYILIEYWDNTLELWVYIKVYAQDPLPILFESNIENSIPYEGGTYTITQLGDYPSVFPEMARFRAVTTNDVVVSGRTAIIAPPMTSTPITIKENEEYLARIVYLQYHTEENDEWSTFETTIQQGVPIIEKIITLTKVEIWGINPQGGEAHVYLWGEEEEINEGEEIPIRGIGFNNITLSSTTIESIAIWGDTLPNLSPDAGTDYNAAGILSIPTLENNGWGPYYHANLGQSYTPAISWTFEYYDGKQWRELGPSFGQNNYYLSVDNTLLSPPILEAEGGDWNLRISGRFTEGDVIFRAVDESGQVISDSDVIVTPSNSSNQLMRVPVNILPNDTTIVRNVYLEFVTDGSSNFIKWEKQIPTQYWSGNTYILQKGQSTIILNR